jgi:hypothetical protein
MNISPFHSVQKRTDANLQLHTHSMILLPKHSRSKAGKHDRCCLVHERGVLSMLDVAAAYFVRIERSSMIGIKFSKSSFNICERQACV